MHGRPRVEREGRHDDDHRLVAPGPHVVRAAALGRLARFVACLPPERFDGLPLCVPARSGRPRRRPLMARITAILVTYNSADHVEAALHALRPMNAAGLLECIVIDNSSRDRTAEIVSCCAWPRLVRSDQNLGYGRALNVGLGSVSTPHVLLMNPDVVIEGDSILALSRFLDDHAEAALVGPRIQRGDGTTQPAGLLPTPWLYVARAAGLGRTAGQQRAVRRGEGPFQTDWISGAVMLARTDVLRALGGFDPRFFLYFEETDLCRRVLDAGRELWVLPDAVATHEVGASTRRVGRRFFAGCIAEHYFRSRYYYLGKHHGRTIAALTELAELVALAGRALVSRLAPRVVDHGFGVRVRAPMFAVPPAPADPSGPRARSS